MAVNAPRIRIREQGGHWVIEQAGGGIIAPFPLTSEEYGTPEYHQIAEETRDEFIEEFIARSANLPPELRETARRIARENECIPQIPEHLQKQ